MRESLGRVARPTVPPDVAVVSLATLVIFAVWSGNDGGYGELLWYPAAVLLLILLVVLAWAAPGRALDRLSLTAVVALGALTGWTFLSILWADDRGIALTGANRTLTYLLVFIVVICRRWSWTQAAMYASVWAASVVVVGVGDLVRVAFAAQPENSFTGGRLVVPIDYANANAALFVLAAWPLLLLARARPVPPVVRVLSLASAGIAIELAVLAQSKGGAIATALTVGLLLVVGRQRLRLLVPLALVAGAVGIVHRPLLDVYDRVSQGDHPGAAVRSALLAMVASFGLLVVAGTLVMIVERPLEKLGRPRARLVNAAAGGIAIAAAVGGFTAGVERFGDPASVTSRAWHAFKYPAQTSAASSHFVTSAGNHRYDFWRIAARQVESAPLLGAGAENFTIDYVQRRHSSEEPLYPHSLEASLLGGTGVVGFALFGAFLASAGLICVGAARSRLPGRATAGLGALAVFGYWFAHGSVDWLWQFPALTGPALAAVACVASIDGNSRTTRRLPGRPVAVGAASLVAAVVLVPAWLAARQTSLGAEIWRTDPSRAYSDLDAAARLNRLSDQAYVIAGTIAERQRNWPLAERYFGRALDRNGRNWYSLLERAIAHVMTGQRARSLAELEAARRLDPREPIIQRVLNDVRANRSIDIRSLDRAMLQRTRALRGR